MTDRELRFADEYLVDLDAMAAALRAGYDEETAKKAKEWMGKSRRGRPQLRALIEQKMEQRSRRTGVTADRVVVELAKIAFANPEKIIDLETGELLETASEDDMAAVASVTLRQSGAGRVDLKMYDKLKALEILGKHLGVFGESAADRGQAPVVIDDVGE